MNELPELLTTGLRWSSLLAHLADDREGLVDLRSQCLKGRQLSLKRPPQLSKSTICQALIMMDGIE